ncbi:hypothetical protein FRC11_014682, partial [Ceratobasidium sp. 423]
TVMIEDENGVKQPWPIIPRPDTIPKNCNVRKLMELGSDSNSDSGSDNDGDNDGMDDETSKAQKAIYRSICARISYYCVYESLFTFLVCF